MGETAHSQQRAAIPATASLRVDPERIEQMWAMRPSERIEAAHEGRFTLGEMMQWVGRRPDEVELVDGEFWFITAYLADAEDKDGNLRWQPRRSSSDASPVDARRVSRDTSRTRTAAAGDTSSRRIR